MSDVTRLLHSIEKGDPSAVDQLLPVVYDELRRLAARKLAREKPGQTLDATALVHEAYVRLVGPKEKFSSFKDRGHFFASAAQAMRRILIDNARRKLAHKRGGRLQRHELSALAAPAPDEEVLALDAALDKLATEHPQKARLVELRYFGGLSGEQAAEALGISASTADRYWAFARAWLQTEIRGH
jgi:RNA polymerase sigma factor (TIGR02999 family)